MKFKCKQTNLVYNFEHAVDIVSMQNHPDYEEVVESEPAVKTPSKKSTKVATDNEDTINGV